MPSHQKRPQSPHSDNGDASVLSADETLYDLQGEVHGILLAIDKMKREHHGALAQILERLNRIDRNLSFPENSFEAGREKRDQRLRFATVIQSAAAQVLRSMLLEIGKRKFQSLGDERA
jgi:hypothetical protein